MALPSIKNRVGCATATTGTGTIALGSAESGHQSFSAAYGANANVDILIEDGTDWEIALDCTYDNSAGTVTRGTLEASSTGSAINLSGSAKVYVVDTALRLHNLINPGNVIVTNDGSTTQNIAQSTFVKISGALTTESLDEASWWDHTNKKFHPTRAGVYLIGAGVSVATLDANATLIIALYKNGAEHKMLFRGYGNDSNSTNQVSGMALVEMNGSSDYVEAYVYHSSASSKNTEANAARTFFNATWIGS